MPHVFRFRIIAQLLSNIKHLHVNGAVYISGNYDLETILNDIKNKFGSDIFDNPAMLRSVMKDYHTETRDVILICAIMEDYGSSFKNVASNPNADSVDRLSEKIAYDRFISDVTIVETRVVLLLHAVNGKDYSSFLSAGTPVQNIGGHFPGSSETSSPYTAGGLAGRCLNFANGHDITDGTCGPNLKWRLDRTTGYLEITGTGPMFEIGRDSWSKERDNVKTIVMSDGITSINDYAFANMPLLESLFIPGSVKSIGNSAFSNCTSIKTVSIPEGVIKIGHAVFDDCLSLETARLPYSLKSAGVRIFEDCISLKTVINPSDVSIYGIPEWCTVKKN